MTSAVQKLKAAFDRGAFASEGRLRVARQLLLTMIFSHADILAVDLENDDAYADINVIASTLKLWFRELPDPLFTYSQFGAFMEAARLDNDRLRHIRLHEQINELPDANYAALKFFMAHLHKWVDSRLSRWRGGKSLTAIRVDVQGPRAGEDQPNVGLESRHRLWPDTLPPATRRRRA